MLGKGESTTVVPPHLYWEQQSSTGRQNAEYGDIDPTPALMGLPGHMKAKHCPSLTGTMHVTEGKVHVAHAEHRTGRSLNLSGSGRPPRDGASGETGRRLAEGRAQLSPLTLSPLGHLPARDNHLLSHSFMLAFISQISPCSRWELMYIHGKRNLLNRWLACEWAKPYPFPLFLTFILLFIWTSTGVWTHPPAPPEKCWISNHKWYILLSLKFEFSLQGR